MYISFKRGGGSGRCPLNPLKTLIILSIRSHVLLS
jgi:hypothetical protein